MKIPWLGKDESGLIRHGSLMVVGTFVGALCNAGFHMVVGREQVLPNAEYGSLIAMLGIILVVSTPMLALQNTLAHFVSKMAQDGRPEGIRPLFRHWTRMFAAISAALVAAAWAFRAPLAALWNVEPALIVLTFAVLAASLWWWWRQRATVTHYFDVVDFVALLQKSLGKKVEAARKTTKAPAKKAPAKPRKAG